MSAWSNLLAASSLAIGSAWDLITHPRTGGGGTTYNAGATATLNDMSLQVSVRNAAAVVSLLNIPVVAVASDTAPVASFNDADILVTAGSSFLIEVTSAQDTLI